MNKYQNQSPYQLKNQVLRLSTPGPSTQKLNSDLMNLTEPQTAYNNKANLNRPQTKIQQIPFIQRQKQQHMTLDHQY